MPILPERLAELEEGHDMSREELAELVGHYRKTVKQPDPTAWFFATAPDSENWQGPFDERSDAIAEAREQGLLKNPGDVIWVDIARLTTVEDLVCVYDAERVLDEFNEYLSDNDLAGEDNIVSIPNKEEAFEVLAAWVRKYVKVRPYYVCEGQPEPIEYEDAQKA